MTLHIDLLTVCTLYHLQTAKLYTAVLILHEGKGKGKNQFMRGLDMLWGFQEVEAPRFQDNLHTKEVRLSTLRIGRFYPQMLICVIARAERDGTRAETRFRLSPKRTSPFNL